MQQTATNTHLFTQSNLYLTEEWFFRVPELPPFQLHFLSKSETLLTLNTTSTSPDLEALTVTES